MQRQLCKTSFHPKTRIIQRCRTHPESTIVALNLFFSQSVTKSNSMKILAIEPYYGGSHRAFLDGWIAQSRHAWTVESLPAHHWKWRMRHAAATFAARVAKRSQQGETWDILFCSDMLNLAEFLGLTRRHLHGCPAVSYFHENQLTYPTRVDQERDFHYAMTNITSAVVADQVWFNSAFHQKEFLTAIPIFLRRMPDHRLLDQTKNIEFKCQVHPPGIAPGSARDLRSPGPLRILWAARWEHDKNPAGFFEALDLLQKQGSTFRLNVIGETFRNIPDVFHQARIQFAEHIDAWGYLESSEDYLHALKSSDVVVSTADHEFFGIAIIEAISHGAFPLLPQRLAYPEILNLKTDLSHDIFFYDGTPSGLAKRLATFAAQANHLPTLTELAEPAQNMVQRFYWRDLAASLDDAIEAAAVCHNTL